MTNKHKPHRHSDDTPHSESVCPNCGHCPTCGRSNTEPVQYVWYVPPYIQSYLPYTPWYSPIWDVFTNTPTITIGNAPLTGSVTYSNLDTAVFN